MSEETKPKKVIGRPFVKGSVPNPTGRPRIPDELRAIARPNSKLFFEMWADKDRGRILMEKLYELAMEGNLQAISIILDRIFGKVSDKIQHTITKPTLMKLLNVDNQPTGEALLFGREKEDNAT